MQIIPPYQEQKPHWQGMVTVIPHEKCKSLQGIAVHIVAPYEEHESPQFSEGIVSPLHDQCKSLHIVRMSVIPFYKEYKSCCMLW